MFTEDAFLDGQLNIFQPEKGFRAGIDSVFVAAAVPAKAGDMIFEAGTGPGVAALCLAARVPGVHITGVEVDVSHAMLAAKNAEHNSLADSLYVIRGDVKDALRRDLAGWPEHGSFAHAFANPPFFDEDKITAPESAIRARAHAFGPVDLEIWIQVLIAMVVPRGTVTMIHRTENLGRLLSAFGKGLGDIRLAPLFPKAGAAASRVIIQGVKGSRAPMKLLPGLVLHSPDGNFTPDAELVLRKARPFPLR